MLPDFPKVKARALRDMLRAVEKQVPTVAPLLKGVARFRQHEGVGSRLARADKSESKLVYQRSEFTFTLTRAELRNPDRTAVTKKLVELAQQFGEDQTKRMLEVVKEAADEVGNVVTSKGTLTQHDLLETFRRVQIDFDPKTLKLLPGLSFVISPEMAAEEVPKMKEWEKDPAFEAEYERIMATKLGEWRDREARRKLVG